MQQCAVAGSLDGEHYWPGGSAYTGVGFGRTPSADIASSSIVTARTNGRCCDFCPVFRCAAFRWLWSRLLRRDTPTSLHCACLRLLCWPIAAQHLGACQLLSPTPCLFYILAFRPATNHPDAIAGARWRWMTGAPSKAWFGCWSPKPRSLPLLATLAHVHILYP